MIKRLLFFVFAAVSLQAVDFEAARIGFEERWRAFRGESKDFALWVPTWRNEDLKGRFHSMMDERFSVYYVRPEECYQKGTIWEYKEAFAPTFGWKGFHSRYPYPIVFAYNAASQHYNASLIEVDGHRFLAFEAPTEGNLDIFWGMLEEHPVTHLVRLTPARGADRDNCVPYWEGHLTIDPETAAPMLELQKRDVHYFATDCWEDHHALETKRLLALVNAVRKGNRDIVAVHCRAGVGRTGAFIAALLLAEQIDSQLAKNLPIEVSIDKVLWQLSLQRPFMVAHLSQYEMLYDFVGLYLESKRD